jgi:glucose-1-phosphatase
MSIEVLVCDLGQVILPFDFSPRDTALRQRCGFDIENGGKDPVAVLRALHDQLEFGAGGCSGEEFHRQASLLLNLEVPYEEFCREYSDCFWEAHETVAVLRRACVRHKFLLSNTDPIHWEWIVEQYPHLLGFFDRLLTSHELRALKPNAEIYHMVEALSGLPPTAHLLIDDLAVNVEGARACGWDGIVYTDADALETELRARNLLP